MSAAPYLLYIEQFAHFELPMDYLDDQKKPVNLTGYSARLQARDSKGNLLVDLSTDNGGITLGGPTGEITLILTAAQTADPKMAGAAYDLLLIPPSGKPDRLMQGKILFDKGQTYDNLTG
jgi:hypothetical protein